MESNTNTRSLVKATVISFVIALITLVLFILPAEYNIDPTGIGEKLGLTVFHDDGAVSATQQTKNGEQETVVIALAPGQGIEYKLDMKKFQKVTYQWVTDGGEVFVDLHGEPKGDTTGYFESYAIAKVTEMKGSFTAPFDGSHGWYWKNNGYQEINIQLIFSGDYVIEGIK